MVCRLAVVRRFAQRHPVIAPGNADCLKNVKEKLTQAYGFVGCFAGCLFGGYGAPIAVFFFLAATNAEDAGGPLWWIIPALVCGIIGSVIGWLASLVVAHFKNRN